MFVFGIKTECILFHDRSSTHFVPPGVEGCVIAIVGQDWEQRELLWGFCGLNLEDEEGKERRKECKDIDIPCHF